MEPFNFDDSLFAVFYPFLLSMYFFDHMSPQVASLTIVTTNPNQQWNGILETLEYKV